MLRSPGRPLDDALRTEMEGKFDADLSAVRLHTGPAARRSAEEFGARAYTVGQHIVIGADGGDRETLLHELTHTVKPGSAPDGEPVGGLRVSSPSDAFEREAAANAKHMARGCHSLVTGSRASDGATVQRAGGTELLKKRDPAPDDQTPLSTWVALKASSYNPTAVELHQILLTYEKLSHGWHSGLGEVLQVLGNDFGTRQNIPLTMVTYGPVRTLEGYQRGTWMVAYPLTSHGPVGSDATRSQYGDLNAVEGHLLNALLHGPSKPENLAPFTAKLNSAHLKTVEEPLKKMVYNEHRSFRYEVIADGNNLIPDSLTCNVHELDPTNQPLAGGYEQHVKIMQNGSKESSARDNVSSGPARKVKLNFDAVDRAADASQTELVSLWNRLKIPWNQDYGTVVREVLETAYRAIRAYESANMWSSKRLMLPRTHVEFTTGTFLNGDEKQEMGVGMVAAPLTLRPPADPLDTGYAPAGKKWAYGIIRGHLLNHHLHGPGRPENMAPVTSSLNRQFEIDAESNVKRMVLEEGRVLLFSVEMTGSTTMSGLERVPENLEYKVREYELKSPPNYGQADEFTKWKLKPGFLLEDSIENVSPSEEKGYKSDEDDYSSDEDDYMSDEEGENDVSD